MRCKMEISSIIDYIENNLNNNIVAKDISRELFISEQQLYNSFLKYTGRSLGDYIKNRKLTEAAKKLVNTDESIINIALEYYKSQQAFSRAFKNKFEITPKKYRLEKRHRYYSYREKFNVESLQIFFESNFKKIPVIKEMKKETIYCIYQKWYSYGDKNEQHTVLKELWSEFEKIYKTLNLKSKVYTHFSYDNKTKVNYISKDTEFDFIIGVNKKNLLIDIKNIKEVTISEGKFAIFNYKGPYNGLSEVYKYIFSQWLPNSPYEIREHYDYECFHSVFNQNHIIDVDVCVPIK